MIKQIGLIIIFVLISASSLALNTTNSTLSFPGKPKILLDDSTPQAKPAQKFNIGYIIGPILLIVIVMFIFPKISEFFETSQLFARR